MKWIYTLDQEGYFVRPDLKEDNYQPGEHETAVPRTLGANYFDGKRWLVKPRNEATSMINSLDQKVQASYMTVSQAGKVFATTSSVNQIAAEIKAARVPTIYNMPITLAERQNPCWNGPRYIPGDNWPLHSTDFDPKEYQSKAPEPGVDYCKGIDGVIKKLTGYTAATGEYWLSVNFTLEHPVGTYPFTDQVLSENEDLDYTDLKIPQRNYLPLYLVPGDICIDKNNNSFEVAMCYGDSGRKKAQLVQLNREAMKSE